MNRTGSPNSSDTETDGQMCLSHPRRPKKYDVFGVIHKPQSCEILDHGSVDRWLKREIKLIDSLLERKPSILCSSPDRRRHPACSIPAQPDSRSFPEGSGFPSSPVQAWVRGEHPSSLVSSLLGADAPVPGEVSSSRSLIEECVIERQVCSSTTYSLIHGFCTCCFFGFVQDTLRICLRRPSKCSFCRDRWSLPAIRGWEQITVSSDETSTVVPRTMTST